MLCQYHQKLQSPLFSQEVGKIKYCDLATQQFHELMTVATSQTNRQLICYNNEPRCGGHMIMLVGILCEPAQAPFLAPYFLKSAAGRSTRLQMVVAKNQATRANTKRPRPQQKQEKNSQLAPMMPVGICSNKTTRGNKADLSATNKENGGANKKTKIEKTKLPRLIAASRSKRQAIPSSHNSVLSTSLTEPTFLAALGHMCTRYSPEFGEKR